MKLTLLFIAMDVLTLLAYPFVFILDKLKHASRLNAK